MKKKKSLIISIVIFIVLLITFQLTAITPFAWSPPKLPENTGVYQSNELLTSSKKIHLTMGFGPENVAIDSLGNLYCGSHIQKEDFSIGKILKITPNGKVSVFSDTKSWVAGMDFDKKGNLIACDLSRGLISINPNGEITVLATKTEEGDPIKIPNDVDIASDGMIYFTNSSSQLEFNMDNIMQLIFEQKKDGGLYQYNPKTKKVKTLTKGNYFPNGVAISKNDDYLLFVETSRYRILKHWLKGEKKGTTEIFIDNLPGFPNGISKSKDGNFWLGFSTKRIKDLDAAHPSVFKKKLIFALPKWMQPEIEPFGMLMKVAPEGHILKTYYDTTGTIVPEASAITEYNNHLYIGGDRTAYISKWKIE